MTGTPEAAQMALLRRDYPGWEMWRREDGVFCAWHVGTVPPAVLRSLTVSGLREQLEAQAKGGNGDAG
jgi:hypothetical protein